MSKFLEYSECGVDYFWNEKHKCKKEDKKKQHLEQYVVDMTELIKSFEEINKKVIKFKRK